MMTLLSLKKNKKAFTLIEMLVVLAIMTIVIAMLLRVRIPNAKASKKVILDGLNNIFYVANQETLATQTPHRILFQEKKNLPPQVIAQREEADKENPRKKNYTQVEPLALSTFVLPENSSLHAIYINNKESLENSRTRGTEIPILPNKIIPKITIQIGFKEGREERRLSYILKQFTNSFVEVDGWVKSLNK